MSEKYTIKPLVWELMQNTTGVEFHVSFPAVGSLVEVRHEKDSHEFEWVLWLSAMHIKGRSRAHGLCDTLDGAKFAAEYAYREMLLEVLEPA